MRTGRVSLALIAVVVALAAAQLAGAGRPAPEAGGEAAVNAAAATAPARVRPVHPHGGAGENRATTASASLPTPTPAPRGALGVPFLSELWQLPARAAGAWKAVQDFKRYDGTEAMLVLVPDEKKEEGSDAAVAAPAPALAEPHAVGPAAGPEPKERHNDAVPSVVKAKKDAARARAPAAAGGGAVQRGGAKLRRADKPVSILRAPAPAPAGGPAFGEYGTRGDGGYGAAAATAADPNPWMLLSDILAAGVPGGAMFGE